MATSVAQTVDSLRAVLEAEFSQACTEFAEARHQQSRKDTPSHRVAVATCRARIDAVLDMYLEAGGRRG